MSVACTHVDVCDDRAVDCSNACVAATPSCAHHVVDAHSLPFASRSLIPVLGTNCSMPSLVQQKAQADIDRNAQGNPQGDMPMPPLVTGGGFAVPPPPPMFGGPPLPPSTPYRGDENVVSASRAAPAVVVTTEAHSPHQPPIVVHPTSTRSHPTGGQAAYGSLVFDGWKSSDVNNAVFPCATKNILQRMISFNVDTGPVDRIAPSRDRCLFWTNTALEHRKRLWSIWCRNSMIFHFWFGTSLSVGKLSARKRFHISKGWSTYILRSHRKTWLLLKSRSKKLICPDMEVQRLWHKSTKSRPHPGGRPESII